LRAGVVDPRRTDNKGIIGRKSLTPCFSVGAGGKANRL